MLSHPPILNFIFCDSDDETQGFPHVNINSLWTFRSGKLIFFPRSSFLLPSFCSPGPHQAVPVVESCSLVVGKQLLDQRRHLEWVTPSECSVQRHKSTFKPASLNFLKMGINVLSVIYCLFFLLPFSIAAGNRFLCTSSGLSTQQSACYLEPQESHIYL